MKSVFFITFFLFHFTFAGEPVSDAQLQNSVKAFIGYQKAFPLCDEKSKIDSSCQFINESLSREEKEDSLLGVSKEMKSTLSDCRTKELSLQAQSGDFADTASLAKFYEANQGAGLGEVAHSQIRRCLASETKNSKELVSRYYYNYTKIEQTQNLNLVELATMDMYLGKPILAEFNCDKISFVENQKKCQQLKLNCNDNLSADSLEHIQNELVKQTETAKKEISTFLQKRDELQSQLESFSERTRRASPGKVVREQIATIDVAIKLIQARSPWLVGSAYKSRNRRGSEETAILNQIAENRKLKKEFYLEGDQMQICLSGQVSRGCSSEMVRNYMDRALPLATDPKSNVSKMNRAQQYLNFQQCLQTSTNDRLKNANQVKSIAVDVGLTVASTALTFGGALFVRGGVAAARSAATVRSVLIADQSINALSFGKGVNDWAEKCQEQVAADEEKVVASSNQCLLSNLKRNLESLSSFDHCFSSALWAAAGLAPLAGAFGGQWLAGQRIALQTLTKSVVSRPVAQSPKRLFDQALFEDYLDRMPAAKLQEWSARQNKVTDLENQIKTHFERTGVWDEAKIQKMTVEISEQVKLYRMSARIHPNDASLLIIDSLPKGHPMNAILESSSKNSLQAKYVFDTKEYLKDTAEATQSGENIFLSTFQMGAVDKLTLLHELGHRAEELKSINNPYSLYNTYAVAVNRSEAEKVLKLGPGTYGDAMIYDELARHKKELVLLNSKSADSFVLSRSPKAKAEALEIGRAEKSEYIKALSEAVESQSDYSLKFIDDVKNQKFLNISAKDTSLQVPILSSKGETVGTLFYDMKAFLPEEARRNIVRSTSGDYIEKIVTAQGLVEKPVSAADFKNFQAVKEKAVQEFNSTKLKVSLKAMIESNKKQAEESLQYLRRIKKPLIQRTSG